MTNPVATGPHAMNAQSLFARAKLKEDRYPIIPVGTHICEITDCEERFEPKHSYTVTLRVKESGTAEVDDLYVAIFMLIPPWYMGLSDLKALAVAAAGCAPTAAERETLSIQAIKKRTVSGEREFDEIDQHFGVGSIIAVSAGSAEIEGAPSIVNAKVHVKVTNRKEIVDKVTGEPTGDFYRAFVWSSVAPDPAA